MARSRRTQLPAPLLVRRDVWSLEHGSTWDPYSLHYALAVREMQSRSAGDPTSWSYQAAMHGTYQTPAKPAWNGCQHASWFFLPWHRMYIYWLERIIRSIVIANGGPADWALFYWNYSRPYPWNTLPPAFRAQNLPDGSPNPLCIPNHRSPSVNQGGQLPTSATSFAYAFSFTNFLPPPYPAFGGGRSPAMQFENATGALENQPHNVVHDLVGGPATGNCVRGWMSDPMCAAEDPIFYLHHSNIDRLWAAWLRQGGGRANPQDQSWLRQSFNFFNEQGQSVTMAVSAVLSPSALGYRYDDTPPPIVRWRNREELVRRVLPPEPVEEHARLAASEPLELGPAPASITVSLPPEAVSTLAALTEAKRTVNHVYLNVEGIDIDDHPGVIYQLYLNLPSPEEAVHPSTNPFFVGHVTFFGAKHHPAHAHGAEEAPSGLTHSFDVTSLVAEHLRQGLWQNGALTVTFVPTGPEPAPGAAQAEPAAEVPESAARIERVTISTD